MDGEKDRQTQRERERGREIERKREREVKRERKLGPCLLPWWFRRQDQVIQLHQMQGQYAFYIQQAIKLSCYR